MTHAHPHGHTEPTGFTLHTWSQVDRYYEGICGARDPILDKVLANCHEKKLLHIEIFPLQGSLMNILIASSGAKRILEIGTLGGFSAICMARALPPDGKLITLEIDETAASVARENFETAGLSNKIELIVGKANESLELLKSQRKEKFDFVFIDADKPSNPIYIQYAMDMTTVGSLICVDNVVRDGHVVEPGFDAKVDGTRGGNELIQKHIAEKRLTATALQTVSSKGYDGFVLARRIVL